MKKGEAMSFFFLFFFFLFFLWFSSFTPLCQHRVFTGAAVSFMTKIAVLFFAAVPEERAAHERVGETTEMSDTPQQ